MIDVVGIDNKAMKEMDWHRILKISAFRHGVKYQDLLNHTTAELEKMYGEKIVFVSEDIQTEVNKFKSKKLLRIKRKVGNDIALGNN